MLLKRKHRMFAFTLVELLVVISIIALLIAILLPSLQTARKQAKRVVCHTNLRTLATAAYTYSTEFGVYPPSISNFANSPSSSPVFPWRQQGGRDWLGIADQFGTFTDGLRDDPQTGEPKGFSAAPRFGVLWPWIKDEKAYLCPSDKPGKVSKSILGGGGNGVFSYTQFSMLGLRSPEAIPPRPVDSTTGPSRGGGGGSGSTRLLQKPAFSQVPQFVEEHPERINTRFPPSTGSMEGNFNFDDFVVSRHPGFSKRLGHNPYLPATSGGNPTNFKQGTTGIGFSDGHVEAVQVNFGFDIADSRPTTVGGRGYGGIPYTAQGLLWHFGVEFLESRNNQTTLVTVR